MLYMFNETESQEKNWPHSQARTSFGKQAFHHQIVITCFSRRIRNFFSLTGSVSAHSWIRLRNCHLSVKYFFSLRTNNLTYQGGRYEPSSPLTNHLHARSLPRSQAQLTEWLTLFSPSKKVPTVQLNFLLREFFPRRKKQSFFVGSAENVAETSTGAENGRKRPKTVGRFSNGPLAARNGHLLNRPEPSGPSFILRLWSDLEDP